MYFESNYNKIKKSLSKKFMINYRPIIVFSVLISFVLLILSINVLKDKRSKLDKNEWSKVMSISEKRYMVNHRSWVNFAKNNYELDLIVDSILATKSEHFKKTINPKAQTFNRFYRELYKEIIEHDKDHLSEIIKNFSGLKIKNDFNREEY